MTLTDHNPRREHLVKLIESRLRSVRFSNGYRDTAEQIADSLLEYLPVTARQIEFNAYQSNAYNQLFVAKCAIEGQYKAHLARCRKEVEQ
jgi:hypothetical protein